MFLRLNSSCVRKDWHFYRRYLANNVLSNQNHFLMQCYWQLLQGEILHERNVILQCVHYIVQQNFFGVGEGSSTIEPSLVSGSNWNIFAIYMLLIHFRLKNYNLKGNCICNQLRYEIAIKSHPRGCCVAYKRVQKHGKYETRERVLETERNPSTSSRKKLTYRNENEDIKVILVWSLTIGRLPGTWVLNTCFSCRTRESSARASPFFIALWITRFNNLNSRTEKKK